MWNKKAEWDCFIKGLGLEKLIKTIEYLKLQMSRRHFKWDRSERNLIMAIRMEHLQIKKHQKIALRYLQELEDKIYPRN